MHFMAVLKVLILLWLANGSPVVVKWILGEKLNWPLDGGWKFFDGRPLFGASKTLRGIAAAVLVTSFAAPLLGLGMEVGAMVAVLAMAGDLFSSFIKRRLGLPPSSRAVGLDQVPESLFPLLACSNLLSLTIVDVAVGTAVFFVGAVLLSRLFFRLHLRDRPY